MEGPSDPRTWVVLAGGEPSHEAEVRALVRDGAGLACADAGLSWALRMGLRPQVAIGDFDSVPPDDLARAEREGVHVQRHPVAKDASDGELALRCAAARGARRIFLFGAAGSRLDQTVATALLLGAVERDGVEVLAHAPGWRYRVLAGRGDVTDGRRAGAASGAGSAAAAVQAGREAAASQVGREARWTIPCRAGATISLVPLDEAVSGVSIEGVAFPLRDARLERASTLGTSNRATRDGPVVTVRAGQLLVLVSD